MSFPALAQNAESEIDRRVQDMITAQKGQTDLRDKRCVLGNASSDEIVVCRKRDDEADRYPGREDLDSAKSTNDGLPRAPDVGYHPPPGMVKVKGCFIPPCPPPKMEIIDVKSIPETPRDSDADLIGRGEKAEP